MAFSWSDFNTTSAPSNPISFKKANTLRAGNSMDPPFIGTTVAILIFSRPFFCDQDRSQRAALRRHKAIVEVDLSESIRPDRLLEVWRHSALPLDAILAPIPVWKVGEAMLVDVFLRRQLRFQQLPGVPYPIFLLPGRLPPGSLQHRLTVLW